MRVYFLLILSIFGLNCSRAEVFDRGVVFGDPIKFDSPIVKLDASNQHLIALTKSGQVYSWGYNTNGQCNIPNIVGNNKVIDVVAGGGFSGLHFEDGSVRTVEMGKFEDDSKVGVKSLIAEGEGGDLIAVMENDRVVNLFNGKDVGSLSNADRKVPLIVLPRGVFYLNNEGKIKKLGHPEWDRNYSKYVDIACSSDIIVGVTNESKVEVIESFGEFFYPFKLSISIDKYESFFFTFWYCYVTGKDGSVHRCDWRSSEKKWEDISDLVRHKVVDIVEAGPCQMFLLSDGTILPYGLNDGGRAVVKLADLKGQRLRSSIAGGELGMPMGGIILERSDGQLIGWTDVWGSISSSCTEIPFFVKNVKQFEISTQKAIAILENGSLVTWGYMENAGEESIPVRIRKDKPFKAIAAASSFFCAVSSKGRFHVWGKAVTHNGFIIPEIENAESVDAYGLNGLVVTEQGKVIPFGIDTPKPPEDLPITAEVSVGYNHFLALDRKRGKITAWGANTEGQCNVPSIDGVKSIYAGSGFSMAVSKSGTVYTWGNCEAPPADFKGVKEVVVYGSTGVALLESGEIRMWDILDLRYPFPKLPVGALGLGAR